MFIANLVVLCPRYVGPCHHGMARPRVSDGGYGLHIWRLAANILNKLSGETDKMWSSSLGVGRGVNNSSPQKKNSSLRNVTQGLRLGGLL
jgi:hypothetical protein